MPAFTASRGQFLLALLRIIIGWHFLYEGWTKLMFSGWSSSGYLKYSTGPFSSFFHWIGSHPVLVQISDQINIWGLTFIGLALMLGVFVRFASVFGIGLLALYYCAYPPLFGPVSGPSEGAYLFVNKNLVELVALLVILAFPAAMYGVGDLWKRRAELPIQLSGPGASRREMAAALLGLPFLGAFALAVVKKHGWKSFEDMQLRHRKNPNDVAQASATLKSFKFSSIQDLKGTLPQGQIGNLKLSRMILGGNLIGGWAHSRDLVYVNALVKAYHTRNKIFETLDLAESCGINTLLTNPALAGVVNQYWRAGGKINFISDLGGEKVFDLIKQSIDQGAAACYVQGGIADKWVEAGRFDDFAKALEMIRKGGIPAGIGGHKLSTVTACVEKGLKPDFWMKTLHQTNYWSANKALPENDNIWCTNPEETVAFMRTRQEPWIAFKTLAAGALDTKTGFRYAFENGADFICVGMYDFQIVDDVNLALDVLNSRLARVRQWCA